MKALKSSAILIFLLILSVQVLFGQETKTDSAVPDNRQVNVDKAGGAGNDKAKSDAGSADLTGSKTINESLDSKKEPAAVNRNESRKNSSKLNKSVLKKASTDTAEVVKESVNPPKIDGDFLLIDDGNFKYKRIPDIKLPEIKSEESLAVSQTNNTAKTEQTQKTGSGFGKGAIDVIIKIGILLLILLIFILYRSRMSGPGRKSTKKRNVLNSYRK